MRGKRITVRHDLRDFINQVQKALCLPDESAAANAIIGACSNKPLHWLLLEPDAESYSVTVVRSTSSANSHSKPQTNTSAFEDLELAAS